MYCVCRTRRVAEGEKRKDEEGAAQFVLLFFSARDEARLMALTFISDVPDTNCNGAGSIGQEEKSTTSSKHSSSHW